MRLGDVGRLHLEDFPPVESESSLVEQVDHLALDAITVVIIAYVLQILIMTKFLIQRQRSFEESTNIVIHFSGSASEGGPRERLVGIIQLLVWPRTNIFTPSGQALIE